MEIKTALDTVLISIVVKTAKVPRPNNTPKNISRNIIEKKNMYDIPKKILMAISISIYSRKKRIPTGTWLSKNLQDLVVSNKR